MSRIIPPEKSDSLLEDFLKSDGSSKVAELGSILSSTIPGAQILTAAFAIIKMFGSDCVQNTLQKRLKFFLTQLCDPTIPLLENLSEDHLDGLMIVLEKVYKQHNEEKLKLFARLYRQFIESDELKTIDEFEEILKILEDLSLREYNLLLLLDKSSKESNIHLDFDWETFWKNLDIQAEERLGIPRTEINAYFQRLNRTGLFVGTGGTWATNPRGELSPIWDALKRKLGESS